MIDQLPESVILDIFKYLCLLNLLSFREVHHYLKTIAGISIKRMNINNAIKTCLISSRCGFSLIMDGRIFSYSEGQFGSLGHGNELNNPIPNSHYSQAAEEESLD